MKQHSFGTHERVRKRKDFLRAYHSGARVESKNFIAVLNRNQLETTRLGITVTKKVGNSVQRNRVKRLLREFFRLNKHSLPDSYDIVIIVKKKVPYLTYRDVYAQLENLFTGRRDT